MKRRITTLLIGAILACGSSFAKKKDEDRKEYLAQVTARGRALYNYDHAAWHGTDAVLALSPGKEGSGRYICQKTDSGWLVSFGSLTASRDKFLVFYEATESSTPGEFTARKFDPPKEESAYALAAEKALDLAFADFQREPRPYNTAVLPQPDGQMFVYIYPAQTKHTIWPLGGDVRYTISSDGSKIIEKRPLHRTILDLEVPPSTEAGFHTHFLTDVPEDTDVLFVLNRRPVLPEYVGVKKLIYIIAPDGSITTTKY